MILLLPVRFPGKITECRTPIWLHAIVCNLFRATHSVRDEGWRLMASKAVVRVIDSQLEEQPIAPLIRELLGRLGEDPRRDGLVRTPERLDKALRFLTGGYGMDVNRIVNGALYEVRYDSMVVVKDIEFFSLCEHHMLPFFGRIHVAYLPRKKVIGLSKIPRIVDMFARRLQIQERLTQELAQTIQEVLDPWAWQWSVTPGTSA